MSKRNINYVKLLTEDNSFQLVRTNPKLTGNIKLTINDEGQMWLNSMNVNQELSKDVYTKFPIDPLQSHPANIFRFLNNGTTPNEIIFDLIERVDTTKTSNDFKDQYDFSHYFSGVKYLASKKYDERISYFAPLYLKKDVPDYFIIFKIDDPANFPLDQIKQKYENGETASEYLIDLFKKASIVKTFDLRAESSPGKYLRTYLTSSNFPTSPLTVSYDENDFTTWNGILINEGTFGSRGELLSTLYESSQPLKFFEENITNGFSRNGVIFPNILNLEFIFNDETSDKYDFNRYLGIYVNAIELTKIDIDLERAYSTRGSWENIPHFRKKFIETDDVIVSQTNPNGVIIPYKNSNINISEFNNIFEDLDNLFLTYINDKDNNLYIPNLDPTLEIIYTPAKNATFTSNGTTITATCSLHGYLSGEFITIISSDLSYSGEFQITRINENLFEYSVTSSPVNLTATGEVKKKIATPTVKNFQVDYTDSILTSLSLIEVNTVESFTLTSSGTLYTNQSGVPTTTTGSGTGLIVNIVTMGGAIINVTVLAKGNNYAIGDTVTITGGGADATLIIDSVSSGTVILANSTSHNYLTDDLIVITSSDSEYSGEFLITKVDNDNFTYDLGFSPTLSTSSGTSKKELNSGYFRFANTKIDLGLFFGQSRNTFLQSIGNSTKKPGHSYGVIKIEKALTNYDAFKIYHPNGTQIDSIGKYDLITSTQGYFLIPNPGEYYIYNDYDNVLGFDEFYMNGGGTPSQIASALCNCINGIRNKFFTAYAYNDRVFIKLNPAGDFDAVHKISFNSPAADYSVVTINDIYTDLDLVNSQFSFLGGSKEIGNRLIIDAGHLEKINQNFDSILIKSSDSWSKIRKISKYIDEITETNSTTQLLKSKALNQYDNKISIILEENETPTISNLEFVMKPKFRPGIGLLSFYSIKDLDLDFYSSIYTNFPNIDLYQHYFIPENLNLLEPNIDYVVDGGSIQVNDIIPNQFDSGDPFTVNSICSYSIVSGNPLVTYDEATTSNIIPILDKNRELNEFNGFATLKDPSKIIPQNTSLEYSLKTKYLNGLTDTEYDFYKENESLDFSLRSKIIPYITKWGIKNGKDSRDNPYRLNTEIIFSRNNFSPDHEDRSQNPENFTHEWFYIESKFNYIYDEISISQNNNYFDVSLDETALLSDPEYFINYFTYTPTNSAGKEIADTQFRYSSIFKNVAGQYEAFFKGFKINFRDVLDPTVFSTNGKPLANDNSDRFNGYRFSCILKPIKENIIDQTTPPIRYRVVEHTDYKFIVIIIELSLGSISDIDNYWKSGTPTLLNTSNFNSTLLIPGKKLFDTINGDYRISFDSDQVSNLTHTFLYSLKNKKYNTIENAFSNIKMSSKLNIRLVGNNIIKQLLNTSIPNYPAILTDDIIIPTDLTYIFIKDISSNFDLFFKAFDPILPIVAPSITNIIDYSLEQSIHYDSNYRLGLTLDDESTIFSIFPYFGSIQNIQDNFRFKVLSGGEKYYERLFEKLSFAKFKKYINTLVPTVNPITGIINNTLNPFIEYESYSINSSGNVIKSTDPNFYLEIPDVSSIIKNNQLITVPTTDIPIQFSGQLDIGIDYEVTDLSIKYELNRYRGEYEPIIKNYSIYQSNYSFKKNMINDLSLSNTKLNADISNIFTIQNFNHIKVAENQILLLESDESYLPVYPKIGEIAIGQADYFLLRGNWDWGFHYKYLNKDEYVPVSGAIRIEEDDSFIAKLISLPKEIELENFKITTLNINQDINLFDISNSEIIVKETSSNIEGIINLNNVLTRFLIEDGIDAKFKEYLINSNEFIGNFNSISDPDITISSYVREYIKLNILKLYDIDTTEFYVKENTTLISTNPQADSNPNGIEFILLNDKQRFVQGYNILKSLQINKKDKLILNFSFSKKQGSGLSISPKIKIKFI